jgi:TRAP-type C4-dicarboxylate transport system permease small subunit
MATSRRPRQELASFAGPYTVVGLLVWAISDTSRTLRLIAIACCLLFVVVFGVTLGVSVVVIAMEGTRAIQPRYLLPAGIGGTATVLTGITLALRALITRMRRRRTNGKTPPGTS